MGSRGGSESFPFLSPFPPFFLTILGKERKERKLKLMKPFPVANYSFPGKGTFPKIDETFHSCSLSFPFPIAAFPT